MTDSLNRAAEEYFGIKADPDDLEKLRAHLLKTYGSESPEILEKAFSSGEAAAFLTVNETYFFREPAHFEFLRDYLISFEKSTIRICSAAVATGCEAYSIAMLIENSNKSFKNPLFYHIDAFDINPLVIKAAREGLYGERALRDDGSCFHSLAEPYLKKREGRYRIEYQADVSLQENICFFEHNLMNKLQAVYDLIFFRNAFIYFTDQKRGRILSNLSSALNEGGSLIMGVSETAGVHHPALEAQNKNDVFYFKKVSQQSPVLPGR